MIERTKVDNFIKIVDTIENMKLQLDVNLEKSVYICAEGLKFEFDALEWWKMNSLKFRILTKMTCDILSIPIITVAL